MIPLLTFKGKRHILVMCSSFRYPYLINILINLEWYLEKLSSIILRISNSWTNPNVA